MRTCSTCGALGEIEHNPPYALCFKHYRVQQMRASAKINGKSSPSKEWFDEQLRTRGLVCQDCGVAMVWRIAQSPTRVVTLQHYRDGTHGLVCKSCNAAHAKLPGDMFLSIPSDSKRCSRCGEVKPRTEFYSRRLAGPKGLTHHCKSCTSLEHKKNSQAARSSKAVGDMTASRPFSAS